MPPIDDRGRPVAAPRQTTVHLDVEAAARAAFEAHVERNSEKATWTEVAQAVRDHWRYVAQAIMPHVKGDQE